jgi:hypothetical protein
MMVKHTLLLTQDNQEVFDRKSLEVIISEADEFQNVEFRTPTTDLDLEEIKNHSEFSMHLTPLGWEKVAVFVQQYGAKGN